MYITSKQATILKELLQHIELNVYGNGPHSTWDYILIDRHKLMDNLNDLVLIREGCEYWETKNYT
jgi:hypothetical protein